MQRDNEKEIYIRKTDRQRNKDMKVEKQINRDIDRRDR